MRSSHQSETLSMPFIHSNPSYPGRHVTMQVPFGAGISFRPLTYYAERSMTYASAPQCASAPQYVSAPQYGIRISNEVTPKNRMYSHRNDGVQPLLYPRLDQPRGRGWEVVWQFNETCL